MKKKIVSGMMLALLPICVLTLAFNRVLASSTEVYVDPEKSVAPIGSNFTVDVKILDVNDLFAWQFNMTWNASLFWCTEVAEGDFLNAWGTKSTYFLGAEDIDESLGFAFIGCMVAGAEYGGTSGSGTLATLNFAIIGKGETLLNLTNAKLLDPLGNKMSFKAESGHFRNIADAYYELLAEYETLNSTYYELLASYHNLHSECNNLNNNYDALDSAYNQLERDYYALRSSYNTLNQTHNSLQVDYDELKAKHEALADDLGATRNLNYLFIITTIVFIVTTVYLATRKSKVKPESKAT